MLVVFLRQTVTNNFPDVSDWHFEPNWLFMVKYVLINSWMYLHSCPLFNKLNRTPTQLQIKQLTRTIQNYRIRIRFRAINDFNQWVIALIRLTLGLVKKIGENSSYYTINTWVAVATLVLIVRLQEFSEIFPIKPSVLIR